LIQHHPPEHPDLRALLEAEGGVSPQAAGITSALFIILPVVIVRFAIPLLDLKWSRMVSIRVLLTTNNNYGVDE
jgi:hypothetical protein